MQDHDSRQTPRLQAATGSAGNDMALISRARYYFLSVDEASPLSFLGAFFAGALPFLPFLSLSLSLSLASLFFGLPAWPAGWARAAPEKTRNAASNELARSFFIIELLSLLGWIES